MRPLFKALTRAAVLAGLVVAFTPAAVHAKAALGVETVATGGFGDPRNDYAWSMAWFNGALYVGTSRSELCVEYWTLQFYFPDQSWYTTNPGSGLSCPASIYDADLRAEIWRYTPKTGKWERVYESPMDIPNPRAPGKFVARDIGFRGMVVYHEPHGKQALYVAGVTADEYIPELANDYPPRLLRTTNGRKFVPVNGAPDTIHNQLGFQKPITYRAMQVVDGRLFVTASGGLTGDGVVLEVKDPASFAPTFAQVTPSTMRVFELQAFHGQLYAGTGDDKTGYGVYKWDLQADDPWQPIVTGGAGRGPAITSVVSMADYRDHLYVGSSGWYSTLFPLSELIRIDASDHWDLVVGNPRFDADGALKFPLSGLPDGFGNIFNAHFWRMQDYNGALYLGTNDWSWGLRDVPLLGDWLRPEFGFDVYGTCDGTYWWAATRNAFGDGAFNFGARTMATSGGLGFIGSANHSEGTEIWQANVSPCGGAAAPQAMRSTAPPADAGAASTAAASVPTRLLADVESCGTALSWDAASGARRYRVLRATYRTFRDVRVGRLPGLADTTDLFAPPALAVTSGRTGDVTALGAYRTVGFARGTSFVDRAARAGRRYDYQVVAVDRQGRSSRPSNLAQVSADRPAVSAADLRKAVARVRGAHGDRRLALAAAGTAADEVRDLAHRLHAQRIHDRACGS